MDTEESERTGSMGPGPFTYPFEPGPVPWGVAPKSCMHIRLSAHLSGHSSAVADGYFLLLPACCPQDYTSVESNHRACSEPNFLSWADGVIH